MLFSLFIWMCQSNTNQDLNGNFILTAWNTNKIKVPWIIIKTRNPYKLTFFNNPTELFILGAWSVARTGPGPPLSLVQCGPVGFLRSQEDSGLSQPAKTHSWAEDEPPPRAVPTALPPSSHCFLDHTDCPLLPPSVSGLSSAQSLFHCSSVNQLTQLTIGPLLNSSCPAHFHFLLLQIYLPSLITRSLRSSLSPCVPPRTLPCRNLFTLLWTIIIFPSQHFTALSSRNSFIFQMSFYPSHPHPFFSLCTLFSFLHLKPFVSHASLSLILVAVESYLQC